MSAPLIDSNRLHGTSTHPAPLRIERELFLGIDPGGSGGFAILDRKGAVVDASKMPETESDVNEYVREFAPRIRMAMIEAVHSMPKQGVASSFTFGKNYGGLRMALIAHGVPFVAITPQAWQKDMGCILPTHSGQRRGTEKKNHAKARAQELFPAQKITHAVADALLIAEYLRRRT